MEENGCEGEMAQSKVLIVEDEPNARAGLAELVASWGYRTETAADGAAGLEMVQRWSPAVVVTDLMMPRMDGLQLLDRIGELDEAVAVVVVTAHGAIDSAVDAMRMGAYDYIQKPIDTARLRTILKARWSRPRKAGRRRRAAWQRWRRRTGWVRWWGVRRRCTRFSRRLSGLRRRT